MNWKDCSVLVTGGAGFIGSHLVERLLELNCDVSVADNFIRGSKDNLSKISDRIEIYEVDLTSFDNCLKVTKNVDSVFHLASSVGGIQYILKENVDGLPKIPASYDLILGGKVMKTGMTEDVNDRVSEQKNEIPYDMICYYETETKEKANEIENKKLKICKPPFNKMDQ